MKTDHLPAVDAVHSRLKGSALLSLGSDRTVTVTPADRVLFAPEPGVLIVQGKGYAVPARLHPALRTALALEAVSA